MLTVPKPLIRACAVDQYPDLGGSRIIRMISFPNSTAAGDSLFVFATKKRPEFEFAVRDYLCLCFVIHSLKKRTHNQILVPVIQIR